MSNEELDEIWFWGTASSDYVESILEDQEEGTFCVFRPDGRSGELALAVRISNQVKFKTIYHRDGLFGYTEPLGFEDLHSALDAFNNSEVDEGQLSKILARPDETFWQPVEEEILMEFESVTELLQYLRKNNKLLRQKADEQEQLKAEMKRIDREIEGKMTSLAGLRKVCSIMEHQKKLQDKTQLRSSTPQAVRTEEFTKNKEVIEAHLQELGKQMVVIDDEVTSQRNKHSAFNKEFSRCITEISELESIQEQYKSRLESQPQLLDFIEGLLLNDDEKEIMHWDRDLWFKDCTSKEVDKLLLDNSTLDGTYLVRPFKPKDNAPYCVCVVWTTKIDKRYKNAEVRERKVEKFVVLQNEGCFGFDLSTCIFESLEELVAVYSRIPFRVHDVKYGNLTLNSPVFMAQGLQTEKSPEVVFRRAAFS